MVNNCNLKINDMSAWSRLKINNLTLVFNLHLATSVAYVTG